MLKTLGVTKCIRKSSDVILCAVCQNSFLVFINFSHVQDHWGRCGSAVECRTLDRENTLMNPLHVMASLMAIRYGGDAPQEKQNPCAVLDT